MAEPVTIGGQTFIKTSDGWVDKKTKVRAPESLFTLLNSLTTESTTEYKKLRVRLDSSKPPVSLAGEEYVFDLNQSKWINKKTRDAVNDSLQKVINGVLEKLEVEKASAAPAITTAMGTIGQAAKSNIKKPDGTKMPVNIKINSPIVTMIEKLATIDGYLKQKLDNQKKVAARNLSMAKETAIEATPSDASPAQEVKTEDASKNNTGAMATALLVGGLIAAQFEPVQEAFKSLVDGVKGVWNFVSGVSGAIADGLDAFTGGSSTNSAGSSTTSLPNTSGKSNLQPSDPNAVEAPSQGAPSEPNKADATPVVNTPSTPNQATPSQSSSGSASLGRTIIGAAVGGSIAGPIGAVVGGAVGFLSTPAEPQAPSVAPTSPPSSGDASPTSTTPQATRTDASSPSATSNQALSKSVQLAAGQVGIGAAGISNYLKQGGVGLNPQNEAWCGAFVNSSLAQSGLKGATNVANSFQKWGDNVPVSSVQEGDVVILTRGKGPDVTGGHVGIATGAKQGNKIEIIAGNTSNKVKKYFVEDNSKNVLQVRRYNPEKPYGAGAVGGAPIGGENPIAAAASAIWNLGAGAIEALGSVISAGLGPMSGRSISESLQQNIPTSAGEITTSAINKNAKMAEVNTPAIDTGPLIKDPQNISKSGSTDFVQNAPTLSDMSSIDYYLTRMGLGLKQSQYNAFAGMRA
jgi:uncharacterized protein (TIGR02594 family)